MAHPPDFERPRMRLFVRLFILSLCALPLPAVAETVLRDLPYGPSPLQSLDVYLPDRTGNAPVLVMVHGGGWSAGDKSNDPVWRQKAAHWVGSGAVFVSLNYRLVPEVAPLEQARDVARALAHVQLAAPEWGGNPDRLVLMGHSAGAHLVALLAADPTLAADEGAAPWLGTIAVDSVAFDVESLMKRTPSRLLAQAFGTDNSLWPLASPKARLKPGAGPILLICSQIRAAACPAAERFASEVTANQGDARVLPQPLNHRALNEGLGAPGLYTDTVEQFLSEIGFWGGL